MKTSELHSNPTTLFHPTSAYLKTPACIMAKSDFFFPYINRQHIHTRWTPETSPHLDLRRQRGPALNTLSLPGHTMYHHSTTHHCRQKCLSDVPSIFHQTEMTSIFGEIKSKLYPYLQRSKTYLCVGPPFNLSVAFRKVWKGHHRPRALPPPAPMSPSPPHPCSSCDHIWRYPEHYSWLWRVTWQQKAGHIPSEVPHYTCPQKQRQWMTKSHTSSRLWSSHPDWEDWKRRGMLIPRILSWRTWEIPFVSPSLQREEKHWNDWSLSPWG